jgi:hypothetical protein
MKLSIWDILTGILLLAILLVGGLVMSVFANPYSSFNPFPPQALPPTVVIPSSTPTFRSMPATWTPNAETEQAYAALGYTLVPSDTPGPSPTGFTLTFTDTPTETETPTDTPTPTPWASSTTYVYSGPTSTACSGCTSTSIPPTKTATSMANIGSASEITGVKSNVWQKNTANPVFMLPVSPGMFGFYYYFGLSSEGGSSADSSSSSTPAPAANYVPILHDSKSIDFTPPAVTDCGAYYLRIQTLWAVKKGSTVVYSTSGWKTVFIFKYDATPPIPVYYSPSGIKSALGGIQNISAKPSFNWGNWNGGDVPVGSIIPSGDYRAYGINDDGVDELQIYQCSGVKGYYIYWGPDPTGVDNTHYTGSSSYSPPAVKPNTPYYLRLNSVDQLGNASGWWTVAMDDTYIADLSVNPANQPTPEQAAFYYDNVKPNNITGITEDYYTSDSGFTNRNKPHFTFTGGDDPDGFKPNPVGYDVVWSTNPSSTTATMMIHPEFSPVIGTSGTYYLKVRAVDWAMNRSLDWMQFVYKFDNVGPTGVTKVTEDNGTPNGVFQNTKNNPTFRWVGGQTDPGNSTTSSGISKSGGLVNYCIYWGTTPDGTPSNCQTDNSFSPGAVSTGVYYLRIMVMDTVIDTVKNETITTPFILKFDDTPPSVPAVTVHNVSATHQTFSWSASDFGSGIVGYAYSWGTNPAGTSTKFAKTNIKLDGGNHAAGSIYYLWVQAKDIAGNLSTPYLQEFDY